MIEFFLIPGTTVVGIIGGLLIIFGISMSYTHHGVVVGNYTFLSAGIVSILLLILGFRAIISQRFSLTDSVQERVNKFEHEHINPGDEGETFNYLRPNGKALINGEKVEVYSVGAYIKRGEKIKVVRISGNKIFVKKVNED